MKKRTATSVLTTWGGAIALALVSGCGGEEDPGSFSPPPPATEEGILTQDEADARAERDISPDNAREALDELRQDLDREGGIEIGNGP